MHLQFSIFITRVIGRRQVIFYLLTTLHIMKLGQVMSMDSLVECKVQIKILVQCKYTNSDLRRHGMTILCVYQTLQ